MNIEHYRNFIEIVESGTISAASRKLLIAQPALSNQIKNLEKAFGAKLLKRSARCIILTDAGKIFYDRAKAILMLQDIVQKEIDACVIGKKGTLWLGMSAAMPDQRITKLLLDFNELYPDISYEIFETNADQLVDMLRNNIIEVAILRMQANTYPLLKSVAVIKEKLMVVYSQDNPWLPANLKTIPLLMLKNVPLSITKGIRRLVTEACSEAGFKPRFINVSTSRVSSLIWTQNGKAVAVIAGSLLDYKSDDLYCRPLDSEAMSISRSVIYQKGRELSLIAQTFLDFSKKHFVEEDIPDSR